jgi:hypothetical protein
MDKERLLHYLGPLYSTEEHLNFLCALTHEANEQWWRDPKNGNVLNRNTGELLMLCVSELAEALEGHRKGLKDDGLPQYDMFHVELVDCLIRVFDILGHARINYNLNPGQIYIDKMKYNAQREDHKPENRVKDGGKKY